MPFAFFDLPPELQLLIKDSISSSDLRTHVCFFLSGIQCASLYSSRPNSDSFWKLLCWNNGLGQLSSEMETQANWRDIAFRTIRADGFCTHPQCGEALLEYNRTNMGEAAKYVRPFFPIRINETYEGEASTAIHRVVGHVSFRPGDEVGLWNKPSISRDAHLRPPGQVKFKTPAGDREYLSKHPLVARSFATFVPTTTFFLFSIYGIELEHYKLKSTSRRPLTVLDVLGLIQTGLDNDVSVHDVVDYVTDHEECLVNHCTLPSDLIRCLGTIREILTVCPIKDMELEEYTDAGPVFSLDLH
ncbi:hypothetical protein LXA43DRAFT_1095600 [Ganoderma leucocontextum]|nr:hypothetical protein LXA43DRAFT_1095600 [Ganoderma leucocontextum]